MAKETKSRVVFQRSALGTRIALLVMLCVCIAAMAVAGLAIYTAKRDTAALRQQALDLEKRNEQLEEYLSKLGSVDAIVRIAQEELGLYPDGAAMAYGSENAPETLAHGLFAALRDLDSKEIPKIYARCPSGGGVTYAVANRLKKAAGFHIVEGDKNL